MSKHSVVRRALAAGVSALALVGVGVSAASAVDTVPADQYYAGTFYLGSAADGTDWTASTTTWSAATPQNVIALVAPGDTNTNFPIPAGTETVRTFISPRGSESNPAAWNAYADQGLTAGGISTPNVTPANQLGNGGGSPQGAAAVKAAGGDYSLGLAFLKTNGKYVVPSGLYYIHIHVTAGTGDWTYTQTAVAPTATTTALTVPPTAPAANAAFNLSATVAPAGTGTVQFKDGTANLGSPVTLASGTATLNVAAGLAAGSHSITAVYSGDSTYSTSTSAASVINITGTPVTTTLALTATSATGFAGSPVVYTATVTPAAATGQVAFSAVKSGDPNVVSIATVPVSSGGVATTTLSGLTAGSWTVTGAFAGTGVYQPSTSTATLSLTVDPNSNAATPDPQTVTVVVPKGALTITTPWSPANPLVLGSLQLNQANSTFELAAPANFASATVIANGIKIVNERPDQPHFTFQVASTNFTSTGGSFNAGTASLINLAAVQVQGNALLSADVHHTDITALANTPQTFATYAASNLGTAWLSGDFNIKGVPSSTPSGTYTATVTFTAF